MAVGVVTVAADAAGVVGCWLLFERKWRIGIEHEKKNVGSSFSGCWLLVLVVVVVLAVGCCWLSLVVSCWLLVVVVVACCCWLLIGFWLRVVGGGNCCCRLLAVGCLFVCLVGCLVVVVVAVAVAAAAAVVSPTSEQVPAASTQAPGERSKYIIQVHPNAGLALFQAKRGSKMVGPGVPCSC